MSIGKINNSSQNPHSMGFFDNIEKLGGPHKLLVEDQIVALKDLDDALRLAAQFHLNGLHGSEEQLCSIVKRVKHFATAELEPGDGRKVESVRVERRLDGSVTTFFGI
ncbi:MAG: hypothetical protein JST89_03245 [Cyanobacteria bacterium SZAS-4]|nr:hypothetical protein [Cyanobacteria bacterium SZAS-4]